MRVKLKPLSQQVMLITGASSGIGRQTAIRAAKEGAKIIAIARNGEALNEVVREIEAAGGEAIAAVADVADTDAFKAAAEAGVARFGRIDSWVNNAGVGMYTKILETDLADDKRLFETNFWGIVIGSRLAVHYLKQFGGGALLNLGSEVSDMAIPVQGMYASSKHAIKGFTDALREEILHDKLPVSVTLIKPAAIDTPFPRHAKNNLDQDATLPSPVYNVDLVADQILHGAVYGGREIYVGGGGRLQALIANHFPAMMDRMLASMGFGQQLRQRPADHSNEALHDVGKFYSAQGDASEDHHIKSFSLYNAAKRNPLTTALVTGAIGVAAATLLYETVAHEEPKKRGWWS